LRHGRDVATWDLRWAAHAGSKAGALAMLP
jgi:hypothetical protein